MQLDLLRQYIKSYHSFLSSVKQHPEIHKWDTLAHFQEHWDIDASDLRTTYIRSIESSYSRRWWKTPSFNPKEVMILLIEQEPELMRQAFRDLLYGEGDPVDRIDRFTFYCDEALQSYKSAHPHSIVNHHYHTANHICSLYLSLAQPDRYGLYVHEAFLSFLRKVKSRDIPQTRDPGRFFTLCNTLNKLLIKEEDFPEVLLAFLDQNKLYFEDFDHPMLAQDFMHFVALDWKMS